MSSFIISKKDYIKAAGIVAGISEALKLWVFDYEEGRNSTAQDYYKQFERFYTMNALSVLEQYGDEVGAPATDSNTYKADFEAYRKIGKSAGYTREGLKEIVAELQNFFSSAEYQTENDSYNNQMIFYFDKLLVELYKQAFLYGNRDAKSWGSFEIGHIKTKTVTPIM